LAALAAQKASRGKHAEAAREKRREQYRADPAAALAKREAYRLANPEKYAAFAKKGRLKNLEATKARIRKWREANPNYNRSRYASDPQIMLAMRLRARLTVALKRQVVRKTAKSFDLIGCTKHELQAHIEAQFVPGMTWENYGEWHVDHIKPVCTFDLTDEAQQRECFHFTNLRPLWAAENLARPRPRRIRALAANQGT